MRIADLHRAVRAESHWLRRDPSALPSLLYNRLLCEGWNANEIKRSLQFPAGLPSIHLRHPVRLGGGELRILAGHTGSVGACAVTPDGRRVVSGSDDKTLKVWDLETGREVATLAGHTDWVGACAVTPDGRRVVSGSYDRTLKVWDLVTGECIVTVYGIESFDCVSVTDTMICAGDRAGNVWMLEYVPAETKEREKEEETMRPIRVFYSYSHKDEDLRNQLETHLSNLQRQGVIANWHDRRIIAGEEWKKEIDEHLEEADIILLLVSADFIASDYCYEIEMKRALERHENGEARVIPIILRPTEWAEAPFAKLQALPKDAKPVTTWQPNDPNNDEAWLDVAKGIRRAAEGLRAGRR
ncbi:MAG: TIR domain-containing protein [bacterium]